MGESNHLHFRSLLTKIDNELRIEDVETLVFLCDSDLCIKTQQSITTGCAFFEALEKKRMISGDNVELLDSLFKMIGRLDLCEMLPSNAFESDESNTRNSVQSHCVSPFNHLLFQISEELPLDEVERLRFAYGGVPRSTVISSALDLFRIMKRHKKLSPDCLECLMDLLAIIDRNDLVEVLHQFSNQSTKNIERQSYCVAGDPKSKDYQEICQNETSMTRSPPVTPGEQVTMLKTPVECQTPLNLPVQPSEHTTTAQEYRLRDLPLPQSVAVPSGATYATSLFHQHNEPCDPSDSVNEPSDSENELSDSQYYPENIAVSERPAQIIDPSDLRDGCDDRYKMTADPRGICLVIDNEKFSSQYDGEDILGPRKGSQKDTENLEACFQTLNFDVHIRKNLSLLEMSNCLLEYGNMDHTEYDCFACCILSHGAEGAIYSSDSELLSIKAITSCFNPKICPSLTGKPKLFFLSCCQGRDKSEAVPHLVASQQSTYERDGPMLPDTHEVISEAADFLIGYATPPGFASFRDISKGTIYIKALTDIILNYYKEKHLMDMLVMVNQEVSKRTLKIDGKEYKQIAAPQITLRKEVWF